MTLADALPPPAGGGAWAWHAWTAQGPQPAEALPANTLAYVGVDLDPPGGQKVAAYNALRAFPSLKKELGLGSQDDLRRSVVEGLAEDGDCDLDFDQVKKWAGDRAALAVVPAKGPELVVVLHLSDSSKAKAGLDAVGERCGEDEFGYAVSGDWAVVAETTEIAEQVRSDTESGTLADDADFQELVGATGDPGVITLYAAPEAGKALLEAKDDVPFFMLSFLPFGTLDPVSGLIGATTLISDVSAAFGFDGEEDDEFSEDFELPEQTPEEKALWERMSRYDELSPAEQKKLDDDMNAYFEEKYDLEFPIVDDEDVPDVSLDESELDESELDESELDDEFDELFVIPDDVRASLENFSGLGGTARFDDGGLELEIVSDPFLTGTTDVYDGEDAYDAVAALPADTALAFGGGFRDGWAAKAIERSQLSLFGDDADPAKAFKEATGLSAADLEALGGESLAIAGGPDFSRAIDSEKPADVPIAVRVTGDAGAIEKALAKLRASGDLKDFVLSERTDDGVVIGPNASYLRHVADPGKTLGDVDRFSDALGDAQDAVVLTYADADAGDWLVQLSEGDLSKKDVEPLGTFSLVGSREGERERQVLRISLD